MSNKIAKEWFDESNALYGKGRYQEAIACYTEVIKLDPGNAAIYTNGINSPTE